MNGKKFAHSSMERNLHIHIGKHIEGIASMWMERNFDIQNGKNFAHSRMERNLHIHIRQ